MRRHATMSRMSRSPDGPPSGSAASVIIPAHDEERTIGRLLAQLVEASSPVPLEIIVVCNGCTDGTADVARGFGVRVLEIPEPSKRAAMVKGDSVATAFPRVYLDADVEISRSGVESLAAALVGPILACGPARQIPRAGINPLVSWYYDVWESLPQVRTGLFGRGVIALSREGNERVRALPPVMSDDLAISEAFEPHEKRIVSEARVEVHAPRTVRDLVRRRIRVATGNAQADAGHLRGAEARTSPASLARLAREEPRLIGKISVFVAISLISRGLSHRRVRRGDFTTWLRDESSRR